jgi:hypothetical protein
MKITMVAFQQLNTQYLVNRYEHMNNQNDSQDLSLKPLLVA